MIGNNLGLRFKYIRNDIFNESQEFFCDKINEYIKIHFGKVEYNELHFTQPLISAFEKESRISLKKFLLLLNYLYVKKNINPSWLILKNNNNHPKYLKQLEIDKTVLDIVFNIQTKYNEMNNDLNDLSIIIDNSVFKK